MNQLREFLRHQYIGAIVIGLLAYQGLASVITIVTSPIIVFMGDLSNKTLSSEKPSLGWQQLLPNLLHAVLALGLAYAMLRWLYPNKRLFEAAGTHAAETDDMESAE